MLTLSTCLHYRSESDESNWTIIPRIVHSPTGTSEGSESSILPVTYAVAPPGTLILGCMFALLTCSVFLKSDLVGSTVGVLMKKYQGLRLKESQRHHAVSHLDKVAEMHQATRTQAQARLAGMGRCHPIAWE